MALIRGRCPNLLSRLFAIICIACFCIYSLLDTMVMRYDQQRLLQGVRTNHTAKRKLLELELPLRKPSGNSLWSPRKLTEVPDPLQMKFPGEELYFSGAFLDTRFGRRDLRVLALQHKNVRVKLLCVFGDRSVHIREARAEPIFRSWPANSLYIAVIYTCSSVTINIQSVDLIKTGPLISISNTPRVRLKPTKVGRNTDDKSSLAVCTKASSGLADSRHLVEWIEFYKTLGMTSIIIYEAGFRQSGLDVLKHYTDLEVVKRVPFKVGDTLQNSLRNKVTLTKRDRNSIYQQIGLLSINDCLYRFMNQYSYILVTDLDEILTPYHEESLPFLLQRLATRHPFPSGFSFATTSYFDDVGERNTSIPVAMRLLRHRGRSTITTKQPKSILRTQTALSANWHGVISLHPNSTSELNFLITNYRKYAYMHQLKGNCHDKYKKSVCEKLQNQKMVDKVIPRYVDRVMSRSLQIIEQLLLQN